MGLFDNGLIGSILGGGDDGPSAMEGAEQYAAKPISTATSSRQGAFNYQLNPDNTAATASFNLSPQMEQVQDKFYGIGGSTLDYLQKFNPDQFAQNYFNQLESIRQPSEDMALSRIRDRLNLTGREGFASGTGSALGVQMNPEMAAFYEAQQRQRSQDALTADQSAFGRFNDLLNRANTGYGYGQNLLNPLYREAELARGYTSIGQNTADARSNQFLQAYGADAYEEDDGGFFQDLLGVGLNVGLGYLTGGTSGAILGGMGSTGNAFSSGFGLGGGGSTLFGGLGTNPFSQQSRMLASQVF